MTKERKEGILDKLIDITELKSTDESKIFKKAFLNKLKELGVDSYGVMFSHEGAVIMLIHNVSDNEWLYLSMPVLDEEVKSKILRFLSAEVKENDTEK